MRSDGAPDAFRAVASPTRRALLDKLSNREQTVRRLAATFAMTLPAVSQQLAVLTKAGLVSARRAGRFKVYRLNAEPLREVMVWVQAFERFWVARLQPPGPGGKPLEPVSDRWR